MEVGNEIDYTPETVIQDISWTDIHPIKQVYMTFLLSRLSRCHA